MKERVFSRGSGLIKTVYMWLFGPGTAHRVRCLGTENANSSWPTVSTIASSPWTRILRWLSGWIS